MQRYDHKLNYIGTGEYVSDMEPSDSGEFYLASDVDARIAKLEKALRETPCQCHEAQGNGRDACARCEALRLTS